MTEPLTKLTAQQAAIIGAYTGFLCGPFADMHEYIERVLGRPVFTHEMASQDTTEAIHKASRPDFLALCFPSSPQD